MDPTGIDTSKIVAGLITDFVKTAAQSGKEFASNITQRAKVRYDIGLSSYVEKLSVRCGNIKTLLYRDAPVSLLGTISRPDWSLRRLPILTASYLRISSQDFER